MRNMWSAEDTRRRHDRGHVGPVGHVAQPLVDQQDLVGPLAHRPPQVDQQPLGVGGVEVAHPAGAGGGGAGGGEVLVRLAHRLDGAPVAVVAVVAPAEQTVVGQHHALGVGEPADHLGQLEAGHHPVDVGVALAQDLGHHPSAVGVVGEGADGVGVHVVDVGPGHEGVQEGLDRRAGRGGVDQGPGHVGHHLVVGHLLDRGQRRELRQPQGGVVARHRRAHVGTRALHPQHLLLAPEVVDERALGRGVATTVEHEAGIGPDAPGALHQGGERRGDVEVGHWCSSSG
jgi:hypothetical protein